MSRSLILLSAVLLAALAVLVVQVAPKAAEKTDDVKKTSANAPASCPNVGEIVRMPPIFLEADTDKSGFPQTGRAVWRLHADANGKIIRREQETDPAVAQQAAGINKNLPREFPPRERCEKQTQTDGRYETVCRNMPFTVEQEAYFVIPQKLAADKTQFADVIQTVRNPPTYPDLSMEYDESGTVVVRIAVAPDGRAYGAHIAKSSGSALLDHAAVSNMDSARFEPARYRGKPVWRAVLPKTKFELAQ
jgi:tonB family C-terminal domain